VIYSLATSPNGKYIVSASDDCTIKIWRDTNYQRLNDDEAKKGPSVPSFTCHKTMEGHFDFVRAVKCGFLDNRNQSDFFVVSASYDKTVKMWNGETGECRWTGKGHPQIIYGVAISSKHDNSDQRLIASVGNDKAIRIWDTLQNNREISPIKVIKNAFSVNWIYDVSFFSANTTQNEKVIAIGCDNIIGKSYGVVKIFDIETENRTATMQTRHQSIEYPSNVFISPCNKYAISNASSDDRIIIHDLRSNQLVQEIKKSGRLFDMKLIGNNYLLLASDDCTVKIIDYTTNQCIQKFTNSTNTFSNIAVDPCHNYFICAEENTYQLKVFGVN